MNQNKKSDDIFGDVVFGIIQLLLLVILVFIIQYGWKLGRWIYQKFDWVSLIGWTALIGGIYLTLSDVQMVYLKYYPVSEIILALKDYVVSQDWHLSVKIWISFFVVAISLHLVIAFASNILGVLTGGLIFGSKAVSGTFLGKGKGLVKCPSFGSKSVQKSLRDQHQIVLGSSGSGKTFSVLEPQVMKAIEEGERVFIIDPKGDMSFRDSVWSMCKKFGREGDFRYFSMSRPELSNSFNPFGDCSPNEVKDMILSATDWSEPHYRKMAEVHVLKAVEKTKGEASVCSISKLLPNIKELTGINADLDLMSRSAYGKLISDPKAPSLFDMYEKGAVVFISLDTQAYPAASIQLGRIFLGAILSVSNKIQTEIKAENRYKTTIVCDEFGSFLTESFINFISKARSSNFRAILATQSVGDLEQFRPEMRKRILDSVSNKIVMRMSDPDSIEYCSKLFGTRTVEKVTKQVKDNLLFGKEATGMMSSREVEEFIVHPRDIRSLKTGEGFLMTQNPYCVFNIDFSAPQRFLNSFSFSKGVQNELVHGGEEECLDKLEVSKSKSDQEVLDLI